MYAVRVKTVVSTQCLLFLTTENSAGEYHGGNSWWQHEASAQEFFVCVKKSSSLVFAERSTKFFESSRLCHQAFASRQLIWPASLTNSMCYKTAFFCQRSGGLWRKV